MLTALYIMYHKKCWCFKKAYKRYKYIIIGLSTTSIVITSSGILGILIQIPLKRLEYKLRHKKTMCKFGYASYRKVLNNLIGYMRGNDYNEDILLAELTHIDNILVDITPMVDTFEKDYVATFS